MYPFHVLFSIRGVMSSFCGGVVVVSIVIVGSSELEA